MKTPRRRILAGRRYASVAHAIGVLAAAALAVRGIATPWSWCNVGFHHGWHLRGWLPLTGRTASRV